MNLAECNVIAQHWFREYRISGTVSFGNFLTCFAKCYINPKTKNVRIKLHKEYTLNGSRESVMETLLHEIAHAIVGPNHGHDTVWQAVARKVGCKQLHRCGSAEESAELKRINRPRAKFSVTCCGREFLAFRALKVEYLCCTCKTKLAYAPVQSSVDSDLSSIFKRKPT